MKGGKYINGTKLFCGQMMVNEETGEVKDGKKVTKNMTNWGVHPNVLAQMNSGKSKGITSVKKKLNMSEEELMVRKSGDSANNGDNVITLKFDRSKLH